MTPEDIIDEAALKAMKATNYCTRHMAYHGQKEKSCTPQERIMVKMTQSTIDEVGGANTWSERELKL